MGDCQFDIHSQVEVCVALLKFEISVANSLRVSIESTLRARYSLSRQPVIREQVTNQNKVPAVRTKF
jgi:hypothetical protein